MSSYHYVGCFQLPRKHFTGPGKSTTMEFLQEYVMPLPKASSYPTKCWNWPGKWNMPRPTRPRRRRQQLPSRKWWRNDTCGSCQGCLSTSTRRDGISEKGRRRRRVGTTRGILCQIPQEHGRVSQGNIAVRHEGVPLLDGWIRCTCSHYIICFYFFL
jgi:hypothetical protein